MELDWLLPTVFPKLVNLETHVWKVEIANFTRQTAQFWQVLNDDEKRRAEKYINSELQNNFTITRGILRYLLGQYLIEDPTKIIFTYNGFGKPIVQKDLSNRIHFNVSHSGGVSLFAFSRQFEVGIDVECIRTNIKELDIAGHFFSAEEVMALSGQPKNNLTQAFFRCWTRKEAIIKAIGMGLSYPLNKFVVDISKVRQLLLLNKVEAKQEFDQYYFLSDLQISAEYIAALAVRGFTCFTKLLNLTNGFLIY